MESSLDREAALACFGDEGLLLDSARLFFQDLPEELRALEEAIFASNFEQVDERAHSLKGALLYLHATPSSGLAKRLQALSKQADKLALEETLLALRAELLRLKQALGFEPTAL